MKKFCIPFLFCFFTFVINACDCANEADGHVYDKNSGLPIKGATVDLIIKKDLQFSTITDSLGQFVFGGRTRCGRAYLRINKSGYKETLTRNSSCCINIYLEQ